MPRGVPLDRVTVTALATVATWLRVTILLTVSTAVMVVPAVMPVPVIAEPTNALVTAASLSEVEFELAKEEVVVAEPVFCTRTPLI